MPIPSFADKHAHDALATPEGFLSYMRKAGTLSEGKAPESIVVTFQNYLIRELREEGRIGDPAPFSARLFMLDDPSVGVSGGFGIGAPALGVAVEELIALGARRFVIVGTAGALQHGMAIGDAILCTGAIRDEGVSYHYLADGEEVLPSGQIVEALRTSLERQAIPFHEGSTWTIDAPYRETAAEVHHHRDAGALTVEMEASALFAIAAFRKVQAAALFVVSDSLAGLTWDPQFGSDATRSMQRKLFDVAVTTLKSLGER
jgi:uridine phosphorylase